MSDASRRSLTPRAAGPPHAGSFAEQTPPLVVAHRGASGLTPENTLAAFRLALELGAPGVECDVHLSADGCPVIIHDDRLERTTSGHGAVAALTLDELRHLDAGLWFGRQFAGERIPTLEEALEVCAGRAWLFVELKPGGGSPLVAAVLAVLAASPARDVALISFDPQLVKDVAQRRPDLPVGLLITAGHVAQFGPEQAVHAASALGAGILAPHFSAAGETLIHHAHAAGLSVSVWTVDDPATMTRLAALGVDAITTNRPDVAIQRLAFDQAASQAAASPAGR